MIQTWNSTWAPWQLQGCDGKEQKELKNSEGGNIYKTWQCFEYMQVAGGFSLSPSCLPGKESDKAI